MGQVANVNTLRKQKKDHIMITSEIKLFLYSLVFIKVFERLLNKKGFIILTKNLNIETNIIYCQFNIFYRSKRLLEYKQQKFYLEKFVVKNNYNIRLRKLFLKNFSFLKSSLFVFNLKNINIGLDFQQLQKLHILFKQYPKNLFKRRYHLYLDFIKILLLFLENKVNLKVFLYFLGQIFFVLQKRSHKQFMSFLQFLFESLVSNDIKCLKGVKFIMKGRIHGKLRANSFRFLEGSVPIQTLTANIEFNKTHVYTRYGVFGFKMWIYR